MLEQGTVVAIGNKAVVVCTGEEQKKCSEKGCGSCSGSVKKRQIKAANNNNLDLRVGDKVEIYFPPSKSIKAAFLVLILPLLLFLLFYYLSGAILKFESEIPRFLVGLVGIALGFVTNLAIKLLNKNPDLPEITEKLDGNGI